MISEAQALAALPPSGFLRDYVEYATRCTDANAAFHLLGGLVCLTQTLPDDLGIPLGGSMMRGNLFALCVGPSTRSRKSAAVTMAQNLITEAGVGFIPETPGSAEGLLESIRDRERSCFMYDEFGAFLSQTERGYAVPIKTLYTHAYDCNPLGRALANKKRGTINNPRVSVFGGSTVDFLERHTEPTDWIGGFLARFLTMYTDRERTFRLQPARPEGRQALIERLQVLTGVETCAYACQGFTAQAEHFWNSWYDKTEAKGADSSRETQAGVYRAHAMAMKIALLLAWEAGDAGNGPWYISAERLSYGCAIVDMHIDSVLEIGHKLAGSKILRDRLAVLHWIREGKPISEGDILRRSKVGLKRYVREILETLEQEGTVKRMNDASGTVSMYVRVPEAQVGLLPPADLNAIDLDAVVEAPLELETSGGFDLD